MRNRAFEKTPYLPIALCIAAATSCVTPTKDEQPISSDAALRGLPAKVKDRNEWSRDIVTALEATKRVPTVERYCAVVAIIDQESGFQVDPVVSNLPQIVRNGILEKFKPLGPLAEPAMKALLSGKPPGSNESFEKRIHRLRTERDLDRLFRDVAAAYRQQLPGTFMITSALSKLLGKGGLNDLNPVTTAGSMQVKISFAKETDPFEDLSDEDVRERLYTREGGVLAGTIRLFHYNATYGEMIYRFADYNAGEYASRNAAFQDMLGQLTKEKLALDGDVLAYERDGKRSAQQSKTLKAMIRFGSSQGMSAGRIRSEAADEKREEFENTRIWKAVRAEYERTFSKKPAYARMPDLMLSSPKLQRGRSTTWFAKNVNFRYNQCLTRARPPVAQFGPKLRPQLGQSAAPMFTNIMK